MKKILHTACLGACLLTLSACGFHLRGTTTIPPALQSIALSSTNGNTDILSQLQRTLEAGDVTLLDAPGANGFELVVGAETVTERVLSVNSNARAGEFELSMTLPFQLRRGGAAVVGPEELAIEKVYLADPNNAVAKAEERELMEEEMRLELVTLILRRLQSAPL